MHERFIPFREDCGGQKLVAFKREKNLKRNCMGKHFFPHELILKCGECSRAGKQHRVVVVPGLRGVALVLVLGVVCCSSIFPLGTEGQGPPGLRQPLRLGVEWEGFPEGEVYLHLNMTLLHHQIRQEMEEQVAQKSSELEQYLQRVRELEDMYLKLQEALEDERQARQDEETVRKLQARCQISLCAVPLGTVSSSGNTGAGAGVQIGSLPEGETAWLGCCDVYSQSGAQGEPRSGAEDCPVSTLEQSFGSVG